MAVVARSASATRRETTAEVRRALNDEMRAVGRIHQGEYHLVCECDNAGCAQELCILPSEYEALRAEALVFAVFPGHERASRDQLLVRTERFIVVRMKREYRN